MKIEIPENVKKIIDKIQSAGFEAYAVGGCVRDSIMGVEPHDWDICTSALPEETLEILGKTNIISNGLKHGTVTVGFNNEFYEITTFRIDGKYNDNRRPESVKFIKSLREDLARRDFTINALAYNCSKGLCDFFGGEADIQNHVIRCVGIPDERFREDGLRILRALRFSSRLGFTIEEETADAVHRNANLLKNISYERITSELFGIIDGDYAENVLTDYADVLCVFIPEIKDMIGHLQYNPHHIYDIWTHTVKVVVNSPHDRVLRLAALLHDISKPECFYTDQDGTGHFKGHPEKGAEKAYRIMKRLKIDNKTIKNVCMLIRYHDRRPKINEKNVRQLVSEIGVKGTEQLIQIKKADAMGQNPAMLEKKLELIDEFERIFRKQTACGEEYNLKMLEINGNDIITSGIGDRKKIGEVLKYLLECVIDGRLENSHKALVEEAKAYIENNNMGKKNV